MKRAGYTAKYFISFMIKLAIMKMSFTIYDATAE